MDKVQDSCADVWLSWRVVKLTKNDAAQHYPHHEAPSRITHVANPMGSLIPKEMKV